MKKIIIIFFIHTSIFYSQSEKQDPFQGFYNLGSSSEIALFWRHTNDGRIVKHQIFDYYGNSGQYYIDSASRGFYTGDLGTVLDYSSGRENNFDAITGDFNSDNYDDIVAAWQTKDSSISIVIPKNIDKKDLTWNDQNVITLTQVLYPNPKNFNAHRFRLIKGFFDGDPEPEFALAYWNKDGNIEIKIFDVNPSTLVPEEKAFIADVYMDTTFNNAGIYDISAGDFDGDGRDEIVLAYYTERKENDWNISTNVYNYIENSGNFTIVRKASKEDYFTNNDFFDSYHHVNDLLVAAGDFKNNTLDQFVVDFVLYRNGSETYNKLLPAEVTINLDTIKVDKNNLKEIFQTLGKTFIGIGLLTGDINNDGRDEIVVDGDGRINIYGIDSTLSIFSYAGNSFGSYNNSRRRMILADLDASTSDSVWNPEIIITKTTYFQPDNSPNYTTMSLDVYEPTVDESGDIISLNKRLTTTIDSTQGARSYFGAITAGDFDGGGIRLGKPKYFSATDIVQPLVILNAPPTHFDVLDGVTYDINKSYNDQTSDFFSKYYTNNETDIEVESEFHKGWSIGARVEGGFKIPKVKIGVKVKIEGEYGKDFSKQTFNRNTYRVSQNISASNDDYIYATIVDYDIWEYPIMANDSVQGYTLVVSPGKPKQSWFPSKSPQAAEYLPDHEVGNILSYKQVTSPSENGSLETAVKWETSDEITLDGSPGFEYNWSLEEQNQSQTTTVNKVHWQIKGSASFDIPFKFIPDIEINGKYGQETISTNTNRTTYTKGLDVHLGPIDLGIGETYYSVQPYAYWAKSGALVLDYAVNPRPSGINIPQTWWQKEYSSKPDPALILPWRLDPEKGFNIQEDKRQQTKEILFSKDNPKPGEIITVQTRIHNYSLLNTNSTVEAKFYLDDPNNGGTLIQSTDGKTTFSTDDYIPARDSKIIRFDWQVPNEISIYPRIYVVLDPNNKIDEIHEGNNTGWKVLALSDNTTDVGTQNNTPNKFELSQNYPNPFNPTTTIKYSVPKISSNLKPTVELKLYDILGREVKTIVDQKQKPGNYEITFNAGSLSSGVYFYRLQSGNFIETKKMMLLK